MIDRTRTTIVGGVAAVVVLLALLVGFVLGRTSADTTDDDRAGETEGDGLPAGPARVEDGIPMGFAQSEDGALAASVAWMPLLNASPASERPAGIDQVLDAGTDMPVSDDVTIRFALHPLAAQVTMPSSTEAEVDLLTLMVGSDLQTGVDMEIRSAPVTMRWDEGAQDWRVTGIDTSTTSLEPPIQPEDVAGYQVLLPAGGELGGVFAEQVPGE